MKKQSSETCELYRDEREKRETTKGKKIMGCTLKFKFVENSMIRLSDKTV